MTAVNFYEDIKNNVANYTQLSCKDLLFAYYSCPQRLLKQEFYSQCNFISYTFSGRKRIFKGDQSWTLEKDVAIFARKGAYMFEKFEDVEHCVMVFFIPDSYLQNIIREYAVSIASGKKAQLQSIVRLDLNQRAKAFFQSMISYFEEPPSENILELKFKELLLTILNDSNNIQLADILETVRYSGKPSLRDIMENNFQYNLGLEDLAKISLRSLPTFKRDFSSEFNSTPGKWLLERRLAHANFLLQTTDKPVSDVAYESGFENKAHFSRVFKEKFGVPPLKHRARLAEAG